MVEGMQVKDNYIRRRTDAEQQFSQTVHSQSVGSYVSSVGIHECAGCGQLRSRITIHTLALAENRPPENNDSKTPPA